MRKRDTCKEETVKAKAIEMLVADGFEGFSMNKLARACGISVATLYIYYRDKDHLIVSIGNEKFKEMSESILGNFDPELDFEAGMRIQWENRYRFMVDRPAVTRLLEQFRNSGYQQQVMPELAEAFKKTMGAFIHNAVRRGEIEEMSLETYWCIAFAPLYALMRFHEEGRNMAGRPFRMTETTLWQTFSLVMKAMKR
ncbi:TetR/AcrR family transcriptional regulator [Pedobacter yulinensis]|uniref:TetR/AcrR family transcriptional regulator n=1 Tax=Pedobacter yulinensis TaxID=2126353 RepID=A0A2T3HH21_9SPHI|nr:TetR/AcrR family transcriptional regulator [Pedobacter yulinensis]PST81745.1 TetR/AcrR family transcriptional regulator [Pedobacter yulinensis]